MTPKQARFVEEYLIDLNATQACIRAGYSAKTADRIGPELLGKACVAEAIQKAKDARSMRTEITQDLVLRDIQAIKESAMQHKTDQGGHIVMVDYTAALKSCELQGKHLGMWTDKMQLSGHDGGPLMIGWME